MNPKISVAIPTYIKGEEGLNYFKECLDSVVTQNYENFEVVVTDNSSHDFAYELCQTYSQSLPNIKYFKNTDHVGMSANSNFAMDMCKGEYIKILHCDDLLYSTDALKIIVENLDNTDNYWLVNGFNHTSDGVTFSDYRVPTYPTHLLIGNNLLGCPTNVTIRNDSIEYFDTNSQTSMDHEWYHRLRIKYGMPIIIEDVLTTSRSHNSSTTTNINYDIILEGEGKSWEFVASEFEYLKNKHSDFFETWEYPDEK